MAFVFLRLTKSSTIFESKKPQKSRRNGNFHAINYNNTIGKIIFFRSDLYFDLSYFQVSIASNNYLEAFEFLSKAKEFNPGTTPVNPIVINNMTLGKCIIRRVLFTYIQGVPYGLGKF